MSELINNEDFHDLRINLVNKPIMPFYHCCKKQWYMTSQFITNMNYITLTQL